MPDSSVAADAPPPLFALILSGFVLMWFGGCVVLWGAAIGNLIQGRPILRLEPRPLEHATLSDVLVAIGIFGLSAAVLAPLLIPRPAAESDPAAVVNVSQSTEVSPEAEAGEATESEIAAGPTDSVQTGSHNEVAEDAATEAAGKTKAGEDSTAANRGDSAAAETIDFDRLIPAIVVQALATLLATFLTMGWMAVRGATPAICGWLPKWRDLWIGGVGVIMILPPIYLLQGVLVYFIDYNHPLIDVLSSPQSWKIIAAMAISSSLVAPLTEEFFFRGLVQGWLQNLRLLPGRRYAHLPATEEFLSTTSGGDASRLTSVPLESSAPYATPMPGENEGVRLPQPVKADDAAGVARWPIIVSSAAFALAHFGQGPAPISLFFLAIGMGYLYRQTGRIWAGVFVHFFLNALTTLVTVLSQFTGSMPG